MQLQAIPTPNDEQPKENNQPQEEDMRIAWRYNSLPKFDSSAEIQFNPNLGRTYDISKKIKPEVLDQKDVTYWDGGDDERGESLKGKNCVFTNEKYQSLLNCVHEKIKTGRFTKTNGDIQDSKNVLRVSITSLGSPVWYEKNSEKDIIRFLVLLKSLIKNSSSVCLITIPIHLFDQSVKFIEQIRNLIDYSFELKSLNHSDDDVKSVYKEYTGLFNIKKLQAVNTLSSSYQGTFDLVYKISRRDFVIETFHLPPDIPEADTTASAIEANEPPSISCGSSTKHLLEF